MLKNCSLLLNIALLLAIFVSISAQSYGPLVDSNFYYEETCSAVRGYCVLENECPGKVTENERNLCPHQKSEGAICCKHLTHKDVNCHQQHNACMKTCNPSLNLGRKGCPADSVCCVLV